MHHSMLVRVGHFCIVAILSILSATALMAQEVDGTPEPEQAVDEPDASTEKKSFLAQLKDPEDGKFDISEYLLDNLVGFLPIPLIITEPAVENGLGIAGAFFHKPKADQMQPSAENMILPNISAVAAAYTGNDSWFVGGGHLRNWSKDRFRYEIMGGYADINLDWYGGELGQAGENGLRFNAKGAMVDQVFLMRIGKSRWYMGPALQIMNSEVSFDLGLPVDLPPVESSIVGASLVTIYENLDYKISPRRGLQLELKATVNSETIGSDYDYEQVWWKVRQFFEIGNKYFLAWRLDGSSTSGDVPFYMEPFVELEGIPAMRYQGGTAATAELRGGVDITPRWSVLGFAGAGRAADSFSDLSSAKSRSAYGVGFRYLMARRLGMRIGLDVAKGPEETYVYLIVGSAW